ncbi:hypothetical protein Ciccas_010548 [Cichlidogyrus casuarinus]|uniref:Uncharacterized protein n=1 Tax=Cichlidogyrus casuarinus TaxID=1844966 RepID=A0ABD2PUZ2_9PLAT
MNEWCSHERMSQLLFLQALRYDHHESGVKYCLLRMLMDHTLEPFYTELTEAPSMERICELMGLQQEWREGRKRPRVEGPVEESPKRMKKTDLVSVFAQLSKLPPESFIVGQLDFNRASVKQTIDLPKERLLALARSLRAKQPDYFCVRVSVHRWHAT